MLNDASFENLELQLGTPIPDSLRQLLVLCDMYNGEPVRFTFTDKPFIFEIQHLLDIKDQKNRDAANKLLAFGVNSDGHSVLVDLSTSSLEILQEEFGCVDRLGITVGDLLKAERFPQLHLFQ